MTIDNDGNTKLVSLDSDDELAPLLALQRDIEERVPNPSKTRSTTISSKYHAA